MEILNKVQEMPYLFPFILDVCIIIFHLYVSIFIFNVIYTVEKDAYRCGPLITVGRFRKRGRWVGHTFQVFCLFVFSYTHGGGGPLLAIKLHQHPGLGDSN